MRDQQVRSNSSISLFLLSVSIKYTHEISLYFSQCILKCCHCLVLRCVLIYWLITKFIYFFVVLYPVKAKQNNFYLLLLSLFTAVLSIEVIDIHNCTINITTCISSISPTYNTSFSYLLSSIDVQGCCFDVLLLQERKSQQTGKKGTVKSEEKSMTQHNSKFTVNVTGLAKFRIK